MNNNDIEEYNNKEDNKDKMSNSIVKHEESDFILFLKTNEIKLTSEIMLIYYMTTYNICFICNHIEYYKDKLIHYNDYKNLKEHFINEHIERDEEGNDIIKGYAYGLSSKDIHNNSYSSTELILWNNNKMLGLIDHMIILEHYVSRRNRISKKDHNKKLNFYRDIGSCIIKIMKEYQIPQLMFIKYLHINPISLERYTTSYYLSLDDNDKPKWMRNII